MAYIIVHCVTQLLIFGFSGLCNKCSINNLNVTMDIYQYDTLLQMFTFM